MNDGAQATRGEGAGKTSSPSALGTHQKALQVNLESSKYGTFAEIGAGQEVARWFFRVGGASGTVAKTMSAYDMVVSDAIYGPAERYVSRQRLQTMLDYEFDLLHERLDDRRGSSTRFFVFADTVTARSYTRRDEAHGWMGIRFQTKPRIEPSQIIIHVRMLEEENVQQQEALGIIGVNLVHAALYRCREPEEVIASLLDNLSTSRVEVDMIKFSGPAFAAVDNRVASLHLVTLGLTNAAMFTADGEVVQASEVLYKRPVLVERGSFSPVTNVSLDLLECARRQFSAEPAVRGEEIVILTEMTLRNLATGGTLDPRDFLDRAETLALLGKTVLISNYGEYYRLAGYLCRHTKKAIGLAVGVPALKEIFEEKYYTDLDGGILEAIGRLFKNDLKLYVYPLLDPNTGELVTAEDVPLSPKLRHLYRYLLENGFVQSLRGADRHCLPIYVKDVQEKIRADDPAWETMVPPAVASVIKSRRLFGWRTAAAGPEAAHASAKADRIN
jgi:hypothetical protein